MAIGTDDSILKFGTQDEVTSGTPAAITSTSYGFSDQGASVNWTNSEDAEFASAVLKCQFATMPTAGTMRLFAHLKNVQSTNSLGAPDVNYPYFYCGAFPIDYAIAVDTNFYTAIPHFRIPAIVSAQRIDWYLHNDAGETMSASWQLYIGPKTVGPAA